MSKLETNTIDTVSGTSTLQVGSTNTSTITLGVSGDTINVPSGVTINNNGTQTGFGGDNTPFFSALKTSDQTINDTTEVKITFDSVLTESSSGVFDLTNNKFTCVTAGKYLLVFKATFFDDNNNLKRADMHVYKNGSQYAQEVFYDDDGHIREQVTQLTFIDNVAQNDYYEMYVYGDTTDNGTYVIGGNDHSASKQTIMQGFKLIT